jgi:hypothetical protein
MPAAFRVCFATLALSASVVAQVSGNFYLDKSTFAPGEPIFLHFQTTNNGPKSVNMEQADPYTFCAGYQVKISSDPADPGPYSSCIVGIAGDCLSSAMTIHPAESKNESILLNFEHDLSKPGDYEIEAARMFSYAAAKLDYFKAPKETVETQTKLYFRIDPDLATNPATLQAFVDQLHSEDYMKRIEAARTLASIAPVSLEEVLLTFADNREFQQFAPLAFHRLNTHRSMAKMAEMLSKTHPGTYEHMKAAEYLAESGEQQWFPLLLEIARNNAKNGSYVMYAAELGGAAMLLPLMDLFGSPDKEFTRLNAISGFGFTGNREAVPILIELLKGTDANTIGYGERSLEILTHRTADQNWNNNLGSAYQKWSQWWARSGSTAPIYKREECGGITPLP